MPDEVGTRGVNSSIIIPSTSNGTKQRTRSILDRIPPSRRRDPNESQRAYEPLLTFSSWTISFVRKGYRTGVRCLASSLPMISDRLMSLPACFFLPAVRPFRRPRRLGVARPIRAPGFPSGVGWHPPSSLIGGRWGTVCSTLCLFSGLCPFCFWCEILLLCCTWGPAVYIGLDMCPVQDGMELFTVLLESATVCRKTAGLATVVACWDQGVLESLPCYPGLTTRQRWVDSTPRGRFDRGPGRAWLLPAVLLSASIGLVMPLCQRQPSGGKHQQRCQDPSSPQELRWLYGWHERKYHSWKQQPSPKPQLSGLESTPQTPSG